MTVWAFSLPMPLFLAAILWAAGDLLGIFMPSNIANLAHLSGLFSGLVLGLVFKTNKKKETSYRIEMPERQIQVWEDRYMNS